MNPINQHKLEFAIYKCLTYGDELKIAQKRGKGSSYYSQMFNPDDTRESHFVRAALDFEKWSEVNPQDAARAFSVFCSSVAAAMHHDETDLCHDAEACNLLKEVHDVAATKIKGGTLGDQLREAYEVRHQADVNINAILTAMKRQGVPVPANGNGNGHIDDAVRKMMAPAVEARRSAKGGVQ